MKSNRAQLRQIVTNLVADGGTAIYDATAYGVDQVSKLADTSRINAVVLLTDGEDTDSSRSVDEVVRELAAQGDSSKRVRVFTIAYSAGAAGAAQNLDRIARRVGRQGVRRQDVGHRVGLPEHQLLLLGTRMAADVDKPYSREDFAGALAANAAAKPFNLALAVGTIGAAMLAGAQFPIALLVGLLIYAIAAARTFFDDDEATAVLARERGERSKAVERGRVRLDAATLAPDVRYHLLAARRIEAKIRDAIERAELPYTEVSTEVDALVTLMEHSASRAQLLYEALAESPPNVVKQRLVQLEGSGKTELIDALQHQHSVQRKMQAQLQRFYDEMERMVVELDTIRGSLVSVSASTDAGNQQRIAGDVRSLRDELGAIASGMSEAFDETAEPA